MGAKVFGASPAGGAARAVVLFAMLACGLPGCGDDADAPPGAVFEDAGTPKPGECAKKYESTFAGIQDVIFNRHGCTASTCHGTGKAGGLDLRPDVAYENLFNVKSVGADINLIHPGDKERSF